MTPLMFLLLLWAGVTTGSVEKRLINGVDCDPAERLYHVKLVATKTTATHKHTSSCGGSLLNDIWILTAAHCWETDPGWGHEAEINVHPGPSTRETIQDKDHHIFSDKDGNHHDIMLLKLQTIKGTHKIDLPTNCPDQPSAFALKWFGCFYGATYKYPLKDGDPIRVAGHGATLPTTIGDSKVAHGPGSGSSKLQCADMKVVDCPAAHVDEGRTKGPSPIEMVFCGKDTRLVPNPADLSHGDSGSAVEYEVTVKNVKVKHIYGVHVSSEDQACVHADRFMNVCYYKKWIKKTIKLNP